MHIVLTGGGTAGHVVPNLAIADAISAATRSRQRRTGHYKKAHITYIGSCKGIERELVAHYNATHKPSDQNGRDQIDFHCVATGKLRRYFSLQNFLDLFRIPFGIAQAYFKLGTLGNATTGKQSVSKSTGKPDLIFSKGGFVGFPVVVAGWLRRIPVIIHESDAIPGLATKLTARFADKILLGYEEAAFELGGHANKSKIQFVGNPVRKELFDSCRRRARRFTGFSGKKPVLLVMGGSSGAQQINEIVKAELPRLTEIFDVVHISGEGKGGKKKGKRKGESYFVISYVHEELRDIYKLASAAISRAGANTLAELEAVQLPTLLYPLGRYASRGDQMANTQAMCAKHNFFLLADEEKEAHTQLLLLPKRKDLEKIEEDYKKNKAGNAAGKIASIILDAASHSHSLQKPKN